MITFANDQSLTWEQIKGLGLRHGIESREQFFSEVQQGYADALDKLRATPNVDPSAEKLKAIHRTIFGRVLEHAGDFRQEDTIRRLPADKEQSICKPEQVEHEVGINAKDVDGLLAEKDPEKQIEKIALSHAGLMTIHAFKDIGDGGPRFVNRTIAAVFSEAQLEHCFGQKMARSVESAVYEQGINSAIEGRLEALVHVMKVIGGPTGGPTGGPANVQAREKVDSQIEASNRGVLAAARANDNQQADEGGLEGPKKHSGDVQGLEKRSPESRARLQQLSQRPPEIKELHAKVEQGLEKRSAESLARLQQLSQKLTQNKERDPNEEQGLEKRSPESRARLQQMSQRLTQNKERDQEPSQNRERSRDPSH